MRAMRRAVALISQAVIRQWSEALINLWSLWSLTRRPISA